MDAVRVEHLLPADLVEAAVEVAAELGQHRDLEEFVLEKERAIADDALPGSERIPKRVRVVESADGELIERRIGVRRSFDGRRKTQLAFPRAHRGRGLGVHPGRREQQQRDGSGGGTHPAKRNKQAVSGARKKIHTARARRDRVGAPEGSIDARCCLSRPCLRRCGDRRRRRLRTGRAARTGARARRRAGHRRHGRRAHPFRARRRRGRTHRGDRTDGPDACPRGRCARGRDRQDDRAWPDRPALSHRERSHGWPFGS